MSEQGHGAADILVRLLINLSAAVITAGLVALVIATIIHEAS